MSTPVPPSVNASEAASKVKGPAIGLMVTAGLGLVLNLLNIGLRVLGLGGGPGELPDISDLPPAAQNFVESMMRFQEISSSPVYFLATTLFGLCLAGLILFGALKMMKLESWGLSLAVSIVAMIPCLSPCCCVGLPIGIWALVVLLNNEVKTAFA